jgi:DNA-binding IclR family transcriptional regulator
MPISCFRERDRPLKNAEIREFTDLERQQVMSLLKDLEDEGQIVLGGHGAGARWQLKKKE